MRNKKQSLNKSSRGERKRIKQSARQEVEKGLRPGKDKGGATQQRKGMLLWGLFVQREDAL